jgi:glucan phosphoethanolaminetransferase (alkaline phosphatase superfamily)
MFKSLLKQLDINLIKLSSIMALIYCLLFNLFLFLNQFDQASNVNIVSSGLEFSRNFVHVYIASFILFFGLTINRLVFIVAALFLFITGAISSYYSYIFNIYPTKEMIAIFCQVKFSETIEISNIRLIIWVSFSIFTCFYTIQHFKLSDSKLFVTKLLSAICIFLTINAIISPQYKILNKYFPIQYLHNAYLYLI